MPLSQKDRYLNAGNSSGFFLFRIARSSRALTLLVVLFLEIILQPLGGNFPTLSLLVQIGIIFAVVFMVADNRTHLITGLVLGIPSIIILIATKKSGYTNATWFAYLLILTLYLHVIRLMIMNIFNAKKVTLETISLAMCTYVLLGTLWTLMYIPLAVLDPNAFSFNIDNATSSQYDQLNYFSFVTLTTLGYGDILPLSPLARSLAILEALTGTLFLAVLISRLVGSYSSNHRDQ